DTLTFSYIGYESQQYVVKNNKNITIELEPTSQAIDEVAVVAYSPRANKETLVGSTGTLNGKVAGVYLQANNSTVGNIGHIMIRGVSPTVNTESYKGFDENKFISPIKEALS